MPAVFERDIEVASCRGLVCSGANRPENPRHRPGLKTRLARSLINWFFTDASFEAIVKTLRSLDLIPLDPSAIYNTVRNSFEFCAVLRKPPGAGTADGGE